MSVNALELDVAIESYPLKKPFRITGHTQLTAEVVVVNLNREGVTGRGEASGVYYRECEDIPHILKKIEGVRQPIESGISRAALQRLLPAGGARNAIDCALWDLDAKQLRVPAWRIAGLQEPRPLLTTFTCPAAEPTEMASAAIGYAHAKAIKLKLTGESVDAERVRAVRSARPDVWLSVDANQGFTPDSLRLLIPVLVEAKVQLIEQPFEIGQDALLDDLNSPIPLAADESVQTVSDLAAQVGRVNVVNIKLDKCGGLTEALAMAHEARRLGLQVMVGNMIGTSLAMAPSLLVGQLCQVVDLDGPVFLRSDREPAVNYQSGMISCPNNVWGNPNRA
jgi:L-alanine-DL-glutamate epimerase-like enolase superfamily enzyme